MKDFRALPNGCGIVDLTADGAVITAYAKTDWFFHPTTGSQQSNVPALALETDAPVVSLTAQVTADFNGTYDAGALFVQTAPDQWAKLAYEFSPQAIPTVVSVVTKRSSDDCDGPRLPAGAPWLRLYVQDNLIAFHFSEDGKTWRFVRMFSLSRNLGESVRIGLSAQAPLGTGCKAVFRSVKVDYARIADFRNGS